MIYDKNDKKYKREYENATYFINLLVYLSWKSGYWMPEVLATNLNVRVTYGGESSMIVKNLALIK